MILSKIVNIIRRRFRATSIFDEENKSENRFIYPVIYHVIFRAFRALILVRRQFYRNGVHAAISISSNRIAIYRQTGPQHP